VLKVQTGAMYNQWAMPTSKNQVSLNCTGHMADDLRKRLEKVLTTLAIRKLPRNKVIFMKVLPSTHASHP